jgi:hypothetical protein
MVIDAKLPPEDSAPLPAPPPAYAPPWEFSQEPSANPPHQQYPPSSGQNSGSPTTLPQWNDPGTTPQSVPPDEWVGQQYRNQRKPSPRPLRFPDHTLFQFSLNVPGATMIRPQASAFVVSFAQFFYSPLGSSFSGTLWFVSCLACRGTQYFLASIQRKNAHDVGCGCLARQESYASFFLFLPLSRYILYFWTMYFYFVWLIAI